MYTYWTSSHETRFTILDHNLQIKNKCDWLGHSAVCLENEKLHATRSQKKLKSSKIAICKDLCNAIEFLGMVSISAERALFTESVNFGQFRKGIKGITR